jgi:hypothetical protein
VSPQDLLLMRIKGEYREMPGLTLTLAQAARLFHLDRATCEAALQRLVMEQSFYRTRDGRYLALPSSKPLNKSISSAGLLRSA